MIETIISGLLFKMESAWVVKISEAWLLRLWLLEQKNCESSLCSCSTHPQNVDDRNQKHYTKRDANLKAISITWKVKLQILLLIHFSTGVLYIVCAQGITWTCQSISQCTPFHRPHQDPAPVIPWLHPQIVASETQHKSNKWMKCEWGLCSLRWVLRCGVGTVCSSLQGLGAPPEWSQLGTNWAIRSPLENLFQPTWSTKREQRVPERGRERSRALQFNYNFIRHKKEEKPSYPDRQSLLTLTLDRIKRSLLKFLGSSGRYFIEWKKSTDIISATLQHDVGYLYSRGEAAVTHKWIQMHTKPKSKTQKKKVVQF